MIQKTESPVEKMFPEVPLKSELQQESIAGPSPAEKFKQYVEEKPGSAILVGLGVGIGAGLLIGAALQKASPFRMDDPGFSEKLTSNIRTTLSETVPSFLKKHLAEIRRS
ncbi:MAG: hypothetical protein R3C11_12800 [Planctomycetaceae bacterium]